jgi:plasmid stability protein
MGDILIRKVPERTKELLRKRAKRRGKSLEADLREALKTMAREEAAVPHEDQPLGSWLVSISRPGFDLDKSIASIRRSKVRPVKFD